MISEEIYADLIDHVCQANGTKHLLEKTKVHFQIHQKQSTQDLINGRSSVFGW